MNKLVSLILVTLLLAAIAAQAAETKHPKPAAELAKLRQPNGYLSAQPEKYFDDLERNPAGRHITWHCQQ